MPFPIQNVAVPGGKVSVGQGLKNALLAQHAGYVICFPLKQIENELELQTGIRDTGRLLLINRSQNRFNLAIENGNQQLVAGFDGVLQLRIFEPEKVYQCLQLPNPTPRSQYCS
ncbi:MULTISPECIES: hypothetical protein [unclassified Rhizobium]|uniref:hypothetical protein n=1 Tax=unclassified Rhizobium TaxID=2613769 RepID=UPI001FCD83F7|nr:MULTISPECIES: hypothetical protein [unclassified Rhizobium]